MSPRWNEPTEAQRAEWRAWVATRPQVIQEMAARLDPWTVYRLTTTGQACGVLALCEDGTVRIYAHHPALGEISAREVYGIRLDDLEPWPDGEPYEPADGGPEEVPWKVIGIDHERGVITFEMPLNCTMPGWNGKARLPS